MNDEGDGAELCAPLNGAVGQSYAEGWCLHQRLIRRPQVARKLHPDRREGSFAEYQRVLGRHQIPRDILEPRARMGLLVQHIQPVEDARQILPAHDLHRAVPEQIASVADWRLRVNCPRGERQQAGNEAALDHRVAAVDPSSSLASSSRTTWGMSGM